MTINDLLQHGIEIQGNVLVETVDNDGNITEIYNGDGEFLYQEGDFLDMEIGWMWAENDVLRIQIEMEN